MRQALVFSSMLAVGLFPVGCASYASAYKPTESGTTEIKTIPASKVLVTETDGQYFDQANDLFRRLFKYIDENEIAMTVPVEARMEKAAMQFYVGPDAAGKQLPDTNDVKALSLPERQVASIGISGSYSEANFLEAKAQLEAWLAERADYRPAGPAYAVYWNGPFTLWFLKRSEVHIPVRRVER